MDTPETSIIAGAGPGLGAALARRFARAGMNVAMGPFPTNAPASSSKTM